MKKIMMTLAAVLCCAISISAQDADRNRTYNIYLGHVEYAHSEEKMSAGEAVGKILTGVLTGQTSVEATKYENDVRVAIIKGLAQAHRYHFLEEMVRGEDADEEGNLMVDAIITNIKAKSGANTTVLTKNSKVTPTTYYTGIVEVFLRVKDLKTEKMADVSLKGKSSTNSTYSTQDGAIKNAISSLSAHITSWLNKQLPLKANIIEGANVKRDKQKEVYIDLGRSEGAYKGLHMGVFRVKTVAGREAQTQIGKLRIEEVEGDDISLCKVQSGSKDIKAAIEAGEELRVVSIE